MTEAWIFLVLLVAMPKLVSFLGESSFGLFSLAWVVIGYLAFLDIGVNRAATKFVSQHLTAQDHESVLQIVRAAFMANLTLGLAGGLVFVLASPYLTQSVFKISPDLTGQARLTFYAVGFAVPVLLVQGIFRAVLSSYQRFGWINGVSALTAAAQLGAATLLAWKGYGVAVAVFSTVVPRILATILYGSVLFRLLPDVSLFRIPLRRDLLKLLRFGSWVTVSQLVSPLLVYLDRVLIASFVSMVAVTLYTVPTEIMTRLRVIPASLMTTLYPAISERGMVGQEKQLQRLYERAVRYLLTIMVPGILFLMVFGRDLLSLWMGIGFAQQTTTVLQILGFGILLNCMANIPYNAVQALGRPDIAGKFHLMELPVYAALCVLLIPRWGIAGAAMANCFRISIDAVLLFWAARRYCSCSSGPLWNGVSLRMLGLSSVLALCLLGIHLAVHSLWGRLGLGASVVAIYFVGAWFWLIDTGDKPRIGQAVRILVGQPAS